MWRLLTSHHLQCITSKDSENLGKSLSARGQGQKSVLDACEFRALRQHCIKNIHDSVMEITVWSQSATFPESFVREHSSLCHPQMQIKAPSCKEAIQHLLQQHSFVTEGADTSLPAVQAFHQLKTFRMFHQEMKNTTKRA